MRIAVDPVRSEMVFRAEPRRVAGIALAAAIATGCASAPPDALVPQAATALVEVDASMVLEPTDVPVGVGLDEIDPALLATELPQNEDKSLPRRAPRPATVPIVHMLLGF